MGYHPVRDVQERQRHFDSVFPNDLLPRQKWTLYKLDESEGVVQHLSLSAFVRPLFGNIVPDVNQNYCNVDDILNGEEWMVIKYVEKRKAAPRRKFAG
jgi:hypothetical protein